MISNLIDDIVTRIKANSDGIADQSQLKSLLQSALQKADIVSRDEFDAQATVLQRTRERVQQLEAQLSSIEAQLEKKNP